MMYPLAPAAVDSQRLVECRKWGVQRASGSLILQVGGQSGQVGGDVRCEQGVGAESPGTCLEVDSLHRLTDLFIKD